MDVDWAAFTPLSSLFGGALIGVAATLLVFTHGRPAGISGILAGVMNFKTPVFGWRVSFLIGLLIAPVIYGVAFELPKPVVDASLIGILLAGFLVGLGTRIGGGCTSGHGVVGLSRLSIRSLVATTTFMGGGFVMVYFMKHVLS